MTTAEAAKRLGLSRNTLVKWRMQKKGPGFIRLGGVPVQPGRRGGAVRYTAEALESWVREQKTAA